MARANQNDWPNLALLRPYREIGSTNCEYIKAALGCLRWPCFLFGFSNQKRYGVNKTGCRGGGVEQKVASNVPFINFTLF